MKIPTWVLRQFENKNIAIFLGAGAAISYYYPPELRLPKGAEVRDYLLRKFYSDDENVDVKELLNRFWEDHKEDIKLDGTIISPTDIRPEMVWSMVLGKKEGLSHYRNILDHMFHNNKGIPPGYRLAARLLLHDKISCILTTNFDRKLDEALVEQTKHDLTIKKTYRIAFDESSFQNAMIPDTNVKYVYKLHGTSEHPNTVAASIEDTKNLLPIKKQILSNVFKNNNAILFIGYSLKDHDIYSALLSIANEIPNLPQKGNIFWFSQSKPESGYIEEILRRYNSGDNFFELTADEILGHLDEWLITSTYQGSSDSSHKRFLLAHGLDVDKTLSQIHAYDDPVLGEIRFPEWVSKSISPIINSGDFQRLRDIKQLSFAHYRYPSATHSRFAHCLGCAYIVSRAISEIEKKGFSIEDIDKKTTVLAALLHDVGHGPFGHTLDNFSNYMVQNKSFMHESGTIGIIKNSLLDLDEMFDSSIDVSKNRLVKLLNLIEMSKGSKTEEKNVFLSMLVGGHALDCDRIDFILRDCYFTGYRKTPVKGFDPYTLKGRMSILDSLTKSFDIILAKEVSALNFSGDAKILCFRNSAEPLIRSMLELYVNLYTDVYFSEVNLRCQAMMSKAMYVAYEIGYINKEDVYRYTDAELFSHLEESENPFVKELILGIKYRRHFKTLFAFKPESSDSVSMEKEIKNVLEISDYDPDDQILVLIPPVKEFPNLIIKKDNNAQRMDVTEYTNKINNARTGYVFVSRKSNVLKNDDSKAKIIEVLKGGKIKEDTIRELS